MASLGVMAGLQRAGLDPAVVWFDAHGDVQTLETSTSGYLGGIPLRLLVGYRPELIASALGLRPVAEDRVVLVDARDLDPPEVAYLARVPIRRATVATAADDLPPGPLYLHVDVDVARPEDLPGLLYPAPGGPPLAEVARAVGAVLATGRVAAVGLACTWRPGHGTGERLRAAWPEPPE
jgi:arginase